MNTPQVNAFFCYINGCLLNRFHVRTLKHGLGKFDLKNATNGEKITRQRDM